jgi:hypothetical protein
MGQRAGRHLRQPRFVLLVSFCAGAVGFWLWRTKEAQRRAAIESESSPNSRLATTKNESAFSGCS